MSDRQPHARYLLAILPLLSIACSGDYPRDPDGTLQRVRGGVMRVGVVHDPPFVVAEDRPPRGPDVALVRGYASSLDARIAWNHSGHAVLMRELEARRLDLVVGGHDPRSPWTERVATSRPFRTVDAHGRPVDRVVALPPGENAWQMAFERYATTPQAGRDPGMPP